jgi:hypothetical protein
MIRARLGGPVAIFAGVLALAPVGAIAAKVTAPCGLTYFPLIPGTAWVYVPVLPELSGKPDPKNAGPPVPPEFTVEVQKVEPAVVGTVHSADGTPTSKPAKGFRITLRESYRNVSRETVLECNDSGLYVDPQSFFYTGEVGGGLGMDLSEVKRVEENPTWPGKGGFHAGDTWREDLSAVVKRVPAKESGLSSLPDARIEVEREIRVSKIETVSTPTKEYPRSVRVDIGLNGRAFGQDRSVAMPESRAAFWFSGEGFGVVKVENRFAQTWELKSVRIANTGR